MKKSVVVVFLLVLFAGCSSVALTGRKQLLLVSDSEVMSLSNSSFRDYMKTAKPSVNAANTEMVVRVGKKIAGAVETICDNNGMAEKSGIRLGVPSGTRPGTECFLHARRKDCGE